MNAAKTHETVHLASGMRYHHRPQHVVVRAVFDHGILWFLTELNVAGPICTLIRRCTGPSMEGRVICKPGVGPKRAEADVASCCVGFAPDELIGA